MAWAIRAFSSIKISPFDLKKHPMLSALNPPSNCPDLKSAPQRTIELLGKMCKVELEGMEQLSLNVTS